jgi:hypothetical protein
MAVIRLPYPRDHERRRRLFQKATAMLERYGTCRGNTEAGFFRASTPFGGFAGSYRSPEGSDVIVIEVTEKPFLVPMSVIESEARRFTASADAR